MKAVILEAPTGFGKTQYALELAKEKPVIISVPTIKLAEEVKKRAEEHGIKTVLLLGRRNYPCGRKVQEFYNLPDDKEKVREMCLKVMEEKEFHLFQGHFCCKKEKCLCDLFDEKKAEALVADLVVTTHALLKTSAFADVFPKSRTIFIDEVHTFVRNLSQPVFPYTSFNSREFLIALREIREIVIAKKELDKLISEVEKAERFFAEKVGERVHTLLWIRKSGELEFYNTEANKVVEGMAVNLHKKIDKFVSKLNKKEKSLFGDFFSAIKGILKKFVVKGSLPSGYYGVLRIGDGFSLELKQVLFSNAMWGLWRRVLASLSPEEIIFASATIPDSLRGLLNVPEIEEVEKKAYSHRFNSTLDIVIGNKAYSYETREEFLDYFIEFFRKFKRDKGAVILASSYRDIEYITSVLEKDYAVLAQKEDTSPEEIALKYEQGEVDVIIGNRSFWEGINIRRDSDFFIVKVPYSTPDDPDYIAGELYWNRKFFPIHKKDTRDLMIQGIGRVIRKDGEHKRVFIADNRVLSFNCLFAEIPAHKRYLVLQDLTNLRN